MVFAATKGATARFPFPVLGIDSDNGSEFINWELFRWCEQEKLTFTRSRSGNKTTARMWSSRTGISGKQASDPAAIQRQVQALTVPTRESRAVAVGVQGTDRREFLLPRLAAKATSGA